MLISINESARRLHIDPRTARRWTKDGKLHAVKVARAWLCEEADVERLKEERQQELDAMVADAHQRAVAEREKEADNED